MKTMRSRVLFYFLIAFQASIFGTGPTPTDFKMGPSAKIKIYQNFPIYLNNPQIERAVIVIHGVTRNADEYFQYVLEAAAMEHVENRTLVLAPHFKIESDPRQNDELYWKDSWKFGDRSEQFPISSYEIIDRMIEYLWLSGQFPNLKKVVLVGHSAGGQMVARYAAGSPITDRYSIDMSYVIANPSSYLYFVPERMNHKKEFVVPDNSCANYNSYPYGITAPNNYIGHVPEKELGIRFAFRPVTILLGETDTQSEYLDTSCAANLQGAHRLERGMNYYQFIKAFYPKSGLKLRTVPNVGHSGKEMFQSDAGRELLF